MAAAPAGPAAGSARHERDRGERVELARYTTSSGERIVFGPRVNGVVRVTDKPVGHGRSFLVERGLTSKAELDALVSD